MTNRSAVLPKSGSIMTTRRGRVLCLRRSDFSVFMDIDFVNRLFMKINRPFMKINRPFMKINRPFMKINRLFIIVNDMLQKRERYA